MAGSRTVRIYPTGMRLHEWIALDNDYWSEEGLSPEYLWDTIYAGITRPPQEYTHRAQDVPMTDGDVCVTNACQWGTVSNAAAGMGKWSPKAYGVNKFGIYVREDSNLHGPSDLADVAVGVGLRAGSHFSTIRLLEEYMPADRVKTVDLGGRTSRLTAVLNGEVQAANLLEPALSMAEQMGLRKIADGTFFTLWWAEATVSPDILESYYRVLDRAEADLNRAPADYLHLWHYSIPPEFRGRSWDFSKFDVGERFVHQPFPEEEYDRMMAEVAQWGLDDYFQGVEPSSLVIV